MNAIRHAVAAVALLVAAAASGVSAQEYKAGSLLIHHAWARATAPVQKVGAGYLTVRNGGTEADRLVGARAAIVPTIELHTHEIDAQGIARMREVDGVDLPPGATVKLAPGGLHLMLIGLSGPLRESESFPLTLVFERAGEVEVEIKIESMRGSQDHGGHGG